MPTTMGKCLNLALAVLCTRSQSFILRQPPSPSKVSQIQLKSDEKKTPLDDEPRKQRFLMDFADDLKELSNLRPPTLAADTSIPEALVSAGSSYTRLWTKSTWEKHSSPPHQRYRRHMLRWSYSTTARGTQDSSRRRNSHGLGRDSCLVYRT